MWKKNIFSWKRFLFEATENIDFPSSEDPRDLIGKTSSYGGDDDGTLLDYEGLTDLIKIPINSYPALRIFN